MNIKYKYLSIIIKLDGIPSLHISQLILLYKKPVAVSWSIYTLKKSHDFIDKKI